MTEDETLDEIWRTLREYFEIDIPSPYQYPASFDWYLRMYAEIKNPQKCLDN